MAVLRVEPLNHSPSLAIGEGLAEDQNPVSDGPDEASEYQKPQQKSGEGLGGTGSTGDNQKDASGQGAQLQEGGPGLSNVEAVGAEQAKGECQQQRRQDGLVAVGLARLKRESGGCGTGLARRSRRSRNRLHIRLYLADLLITARWLLFQGVQYHLGIGRAHV